MPVKYGGVMQVQSIPITEFGFPQPKPKVEHSWWEGWLTAFRVLLTVAEIGLAFLPGVGAIADIGIGLAFGVVNEILDVATGSANVVGGLLNFGAPIIGGVFTGANNIRKVSKTIANAEKLGEWGAVEILRDIPKLEAFNRGAKTAREALIEQKELASILNSSLTGAEGLLSKVTYDPLPEVNALLNADKALKLSDNIAREAFEDERFQRVVRALTTSEEEFQFLLSLLKRATNGRELREYLFAYANSLDSIEGIQFLRTFQNQIDDFAKSVVAISPEHLNAMVDFNNQISNALGGVIKSIEKDESIWHKINKFFSSQKGYKFTQAVQLIDPNDLGRAPVEELYKMLRKKISKAFAKIGRFAKAEENIREAFAKGGGIVVDSQWHIGYKIVKKFANTNVVQITYIKNANTNALRNVIVMATDRQLKLYEASPGRMYRNTWALSTGKKIDLDSMLDVITGFKNPKALAGVLGFIPVQSLRNILSLISNVVENVDAMVKGNWLVTNKHWMTVFKSFRNTAISRTFRLGTFAFGEGLSKMYGKKIFKYVAKEIQRVNTNLTVKGIKNVMAGKKFMSGKVPNNFVHMFGISARSHSLRNLRKRNSGIPQMLTARRKLEIVKRIPNTVVPGRPFNGFRFK